MTEDVMGGVSKENGAKDCAVEAAAPLPDPGTKGRRATAGRAHPWSGTALTPR